MNSNVRNQKGVNNTGGKTQHVASSRGVRALIALILGCVFVFPFGGAGLNTVSAQNGSSAIFLPLVTKQVNTSLPSSTMPVLHAPFIDVEDVAATRFSRMAVTWFGKVSTTDNSTDLRIGYNRHSLYVALTTIDRYMWYDASSPTAGEVRSWDAALLFLKTADGKLMRFDGQLSFSNPREKYQAAYTQSGSSWTALNAPFVTETVWRGTGVNGQTGEGWWIIYKIPFSSLGLSGMPAANTGWEMAVSVYDQDTGPGGAVKTTVWPTGFSEATARGFAKMTFGYPTYTPPAVPVAGTVDIKQGPNVTVADASVGGSTICGGPVNKWTEWGNLVWDTGDKSEIAVIQNQKDVSDFPCFSRYFVTFPIDAIPPGKVILSAKLTMYQFGGSNPAEAISSYIHVFRVNQPWAESTITWNNAPQAVENYPATKVDPLPTYPGEPGIARTWDVTQALNTVYNSSQKSLQLALYSGDSAMHSGKYFRSSETARWSTVTPPTLTIQWGEP